MSQEAREGGAKKVVAGGGKDSGVVALMVEVADALTSEDSRRPSINVGVVGGELKKGGDGGFILSIPLFLFPPLFPFLIPSFVPLFLFFL